MNRVVSNAIYICILLVASDVPRPAPMDKPIGVDVLFSPRGGVTNRIVEEIKCAERGIIVQAYSFTSRPIADALIGARYRGVDVEVCADDSNKNPDTSVVDELADEGVRVYLDGRHAISHSKVIVIDGSLTITGSFNWSKSAEFSNLENCLFIKSDVLAEEYTKNFLSHRSHCVQLISEKMCGLREVE